MVHNEKVVIIQTSAYTCNSIKEISCAFKVSKNGHSIQEYKELSSIMENRADKRFLFALISRLSESNLQMNAERRLSFENRRLLLRFVLLLGPIFLILSFGQQAVELAIVTSLAILGSSIVIWFLCRFYKETAMQFQLVFRIVDVCLIFIVLYHLALFVGEPQYSFVYIISIVAAVSTHGIVGLLAVGLTSTLAVYIERILLTNLGLISFDFAQFADAAFISSIFFVTGAYVNLLIKQREKAEHSVILQVDRLKALVESAAVINAKLGLQPVLNAVCRITSRVLKIDIVTISLLNNDKKTLEVKAAAGLTDDQIERLRPVSIGTLQNLANSSLELVYTEDVQSLDGLPNIDFYREIDLHSTLATALMHENELIGRLNVGSIGRKREFGEDELSLLLGIANQAALAIQNATLFNDITVSKMELENSYDATLRGWVNALDLRDNETRGHTQRVTELTCQLAKEFGLNADNLVHIRRGALLHDIGKIGIPDHILKKRGPLDSDEWDLMKLHPLFAYEMLQSIDYLTPALDIPLYHHEKWDGTGYPYGLKGKDIPLVARLFAIVDVWDAMRSDRPYRKAMPDEVVIEHLLEQSGKQFDPDVVDIFLKLITSSSSQ